MPPQDCAALDVHEGFDKTGDPAANAYNKTEVIVLRDGNSGEPLHAVTYVAAPMPGQHWPSADYRDTMVRGAREHGLPPDYIAALERLKIE